MKQTGVKEYWFAVLFPHSTEGCKNLPKKLVKMKVCYLGRITTTYCCINFVENQLTNQPPKPPKIQTNN